MRVIISPPQGVEGAFAELQTEGITVEFDWLFLQRRLPFPSTLPIHGPA